VGGDANILSQSAEHVWSSEAGDAVCTTSVVATLPLNASFASVVELGLYLGQLGKGGANGFLAKDPMIV